MEDRFSRAERLEARCSQFGIEVIMLCKSLKLHHLNSTIINQLIRAATSIGANYMEANGASSRKDFKNKIFICKKEAKECRHWLLMLIQLHPEEKVKIDQLNQEAQELTLIFSKICGSLSK